MSDNFYSASLSRTQGRNTWAVIFRHPKRTDPTTGKEGLRVRQSLKTDNEQEAATLRDQMNALLASPQLWDLGAREQALGLFDPRIVDILFLPARRWRDRLPRSARRRHQASVIANQRLSARALSAGRYP